MKNTKRTLLLACLCSFFIAHTACGGDTGSGQTTNNNTKKEDMNASDMGASDLSEEKDTSDMAEEDQGKEDMSDEDMTSSDQGMQDQDMQDQGTDQGTEDMVEDMPPPPLEDPGHFVYPMGRAETNAETITVRGVGENITELVSITVNGVAATSDDGFATWSATVPLTNGENVLTAVFEDRFAQTVEESVTIDRVMFIEETDNYALDTDDNRVIFYDQQQYALGSFDLTTKKSSLIYQDDPMGALPIGASADVAVDSVADIAYVCSHQSNAIFKIDMKTGVSTVLSSDTVGMGDMFTRPEFMVLDLMKKRLIVYNKSGRELTTVDINTGERNKIMTDRQISIVGTPVDMALDSVNQKLYISGIQHVGELDLGTGMMRRATGKNVGAGPAVGQIRGIGFDESTSKLYAFEYQYNMIHHVDLTTGERNKLADVDSETFGYTPRVLVDSANKRLIMYDPNALNWATLDLQTNMFEYLTGPEKTDIVEAIHDKNKNRIIAITRRGGILAKDLATGQVTEVIADRDNDGQNGIRTILDPTGAMLYILKKKEPPQNGRVAPTPNSMIEVFDLQTDMIKVLSGPGVPNSDEPFDNLKDFALNKAGDTIYALSYAPSVFSVDVQTGQRTKLMPMMGMSTYMFSEMQHLVWDNKNDQLVFFDRPESMPIVAVDANPTSGSLAVRTLMGKNGAMLESPGYYSDAYMGRYVWLVERRREAHLLDLDTNTYEQIPLEMESIASMNHVGKHGALVGAGSNPRIWQLSPAHDERILLIDNIKAGN